MPQPPEEPHDQKAPHAAGGTAKSGRHDESAAMSGFPTDLAPSLPAALSSDAAFSMRHLLGDLRSGDRIGEFELIAELGRGGFGSVFLAQQTSLDRLVALKITPDEGSEGRTLAQLEHENIVQVYTELVDELSGYRLLCMQYVAGPTLQETIDRLREDDPDTWSGQRILKIIDGLQLEKTAFDPTALRDRELLGRADWIETVCWTGTRLAEALAYAAERGILHRDIKSANILLSQYGRPLLADFNLAHRTLEGDEGTAVRFGGTLAYMSPESLEAFNPEHSAGPETTDARSDLYSLGTVLFQLRHGHLPFDAGRLRGPLTPTVLSEMTTQRRNEAPRPSSEFQRHALDTVIERCLAPEPEQRYQTPIELAETLEGCRQLRQVERELPAPNVLIRPALRWTFVWLLVLGLVPHLIGSGIQIGYNAVRIVGQLTPRQHEAFVQLVIGYNLLVYPLCSLWLMGKLLCVFRGWRNVVRQEKENGLDMDRARRQAVELPKNAALLGCFGWFPGAIVFPLGIHWIGGPLPPSAWGHFVISFALAGLIAITYSFLGTQLIVLRMMYHRMWNNLRRFRETTARELKPIESRVRLFQLLAGTIPLAGAVLLVSVSPQAYHAAEHDVFRLLVIFLIMLGMAGVQFANAAHRQLSKILATFTARGA